MTTSKTPARACRVCGKPLTDPLSVDVGLGPVCRVAEKLRQVGDRQQDLFGAERSTYSYDLAGDVVCVVDHDRGRSVTNDAERVVEDLVECLGTLAGRTVIYRDTWGVWDELVVREDRFAGFRAVARRDRGEALALVAQRRAAAAPVPAVDLDAFLSGDGMVEVARVTTDLRGVVTAVTFLGA